MEFGYICSECGRRFAIEPGLMVCPQCARAQLSDEPLRGILEVELTGKTPEDLTIASLLPVEPQFFPSIPVGNTPLWAPERLRRDLGFPGLYIKDDGLNPTCSLKDRASFLVSAFASKFAIEEIVLASTGNAGSSMAGVGAAAERSGEEVSRIEVLLGTSGVFVVCEGGLSAVATTVPEPTAGLVVYDLRTALRRLDEASAADAPKRRARKAAGG